MPPLYRLELPDRTVTFTDAPPAVVAALLCSTVLGRPVQLLIGVETTTSDTLNEEISTSAEDGRTRTRTAVLWRSGDLRVT